MIKTGPVVREASRLWIEGEIPSDEYFAEAFAEARAAARVDVEARLKAAEPDSFMSKLKQAAHFVLHQC